MRWPLISYPTALPRGEAGKALGPFIRICQGHETDEGLYRHQLRHVKQWFFVGATLLALIGAIARLAALAAMPEPVQNAVWTLAVLIALAGHEVLYAVSRHYRTWAEADAYRAQMKYPFRTGMYLSVEDAASRLAGPRYRLRITVEQARELLR